MMFTELPFLDRFRAAANSGFRAVEFLFPYEYEPAELARRLAHNDLRQALFNMPPGRWDAGERGMAILPDRKDDFRSSLAHALAYAESLGCNQIHVMAGTLPDGLTRSAAETSYIENLKFACDSAAKQDVRILIEPINTRVDIPGYFLNTAEQAKRIIEAVDSDNIFLQCDLYHAQIMHGDLAATIKEYLPLIRHFQIAGVPGRHEPDEGEIHYPFLFNLIDSLGYAGWIGCEYRPAGETLDGLGWAFDYEIGGRGGG